MGSFWTPWRIPPNLVPGQRVEVTQFLWNAGGDTVRARLQLVGAGVNAPEHRVTVLPGALVTVVDTLQVPLSATTEPYFLRLPRDGAMYRWGNSPDATLPASPPLLTAVADARRRRPSHA